MNKIMIIFIFLEIYILEELTIYLSTFVLHFPCLTRYLSSIFLSWFLELCLNSVSHLGSHRALIIFRLGQLKGLQVDYIVGMKSSGALSPLLGQQEHFKSSQTLQAVTPLQVGCHQMGTRLGEHPPESLREKGRFRFESLSFRH